MLFWYVLFTLYCLKIAQFEVKGDKLYQLNYIEITAEGLFRESRTGSLVDIIIMIFISIIQ